MSDKLSAEERSVPDEVTSGTPLMHRIIGSAVIIGLAVIVFSWLLGTPSRTTVEPESNGVEQPDEDVFISRIVTPEEVKVLEPQPKQNVQIEASGVEQADSINSPTNNVPTPLKPSEPTITLMDSQSEAEVGASIESNTSSTQTTQQRVEMAKTEPPAKPVDKVEPVAPPKKPADSSQTQFAKVSGWVVQMGAYSKLAGANATVDQLKENQIVAKINKSSDNSKTIYRVFVGPFKNRAAAEDASQQIAKRTNMKPFVRKQ